MRFACEHELNRHLRIADERGDRLDVPQNQIRPLVGREPARETDGERVQAQGVPHLRDKIRGFAPALGLPGRQPARDLDELRFQRLMRFPELTVVDGVDAIPEVRRAGPLRPVRPQVTVVHLAHLGREPCLHVHAVGDVADRHAIVAARAEERLPHRARDVSVQRGNGVGALAQLQGEDRHAEPFVMVAGRHAPEPHELVLRQPEGFAQRAKVLVHQRRREPIVARRYRACGS